MSISEDWMDARTLGMLSKGLFSCVLVFVVCWFFCSRGGSLWIIRFERITFFSLCGYVVLDRLYFDYFFFVFLSLSYQPFSLARGA
jgi:hypothetical protein